MKVDPNKLAILKNWHHSKNINDVLVAIKNEMTS